MIDIPVEDFIFVVCALVGGGLLLITVLLDDIRIEPMSAAQ